jgi:hypothetical protein
VGGAVTKSFKAGLAISLLGTIVALARCAVENSPTTPGAVSCLPDATAIAFFRSSLMTSGTGLANCTSCHTNTNTTLSSRFKLITTSSTDSDIKINLCITYSFGQNSSSKAIVNHPQEASHGGGVFAASSYQTLIDWVNAYKLPTTN